MNPNRKHFLAFCCYFSYLINFSLQQFRIIRCIDKVVTSCDTYAKEGGKVYHCKYNIPWKKDSLCHKYLSYAQGLAELPWDKTKWNKTTFSLIRSQLSVWGMYVKRRAMGGPGLWHIPTLKHQLEAFGFRTQAIPQKLSKLKIIYKQKREKYK